MYHFLIQQFCNFDPIKSLAFVVLHYLLRYLPRGVSAASNNLTRGVRRGGSDGLSDPHFAPWVHIFRKIISIIIEY